MLIQSFLCGLRTGEPDGAQILGPFLFLPGIQQTIDLSVSQAQGAAVSAVSAIAVQWNNGADFFQLTTNTGQRMTLNAGFVAGSDEPDRLFWLPVLVKNPAQITGLLDNLNPNDFLRLWFINRFPQSKPR